MYFNDTTMHRTVLDCGAGGDCPPLSLFSEYGYLTHGIEFNTNQLEEANKYASRKNQYLNYEANTSLMLHFHI